MSGSATIDKMTEHKLKMLEDDGDGAYLCVTCNYSTGFIAVGSFCDGCGSKHADIQKACIAMHAQLSASFTEFKELKDALTSCSEADLNAYVDKYRDMLSAIHYSKKSKLEAAAKKLIGKGDEDNIKKWIDFQHGQLDQLKQKGYADFDKLA